MTPFVFYGIMLHVRRLFIIRKDLHLTSGKLASQVGHCCEAYWTNLMKAFGAVDNEFMTLPAESLDYPGRQALYKHPVLYAKAKEAFEAGNKTFVVEKENPRKSVSITVEIPKDIWNEYVNGIFTKTICEARNLNNLKKAETIAEELGLVKYVDYGYINDKCLTELKPENEDGTCTVGIWFRPLPDDIAHKISKKFPLYRD